MTKVPYRPAHAGRAMREKRRRESSKRSTAMTRPLHSPVADWIGIDAQQVGGRWLGSTPSKRLEGGEKAARKQARAPTVGRAVVLTGGRRRERKRRGGGKEGGRAGGSLALLAGAFDSKKGGSPCCAAFSSPASASSPPFPALPGWFSSGPLSFLRLGDTLALSTPREPYPLRFVSKRQVKQKHPIPTPTLTLSLLLKQGLVRNKYSKCGDNTWYRTRDSVRLSHNLP